MEGMPSLRWRRLDLFKIFCLLVVPLFLLVSYWTPLHGRTPTREELRDTLRELDDAAYLQSGCDDVAKVLARCEKFRVECPSQYYFELRTINRNCHALSTKELEDCLLETPGGKCVFEMVATWCGEGITEVLTCHKGSMQKLLEKVLSPPFDSSAPAPAPAAAQQQPSAPQRPSPAPEPPAPEPPALSQQHEEWRSALRAAAAASRVAAAEEKELRLISWALPSLDLQALEEADTRGDFVDLAALEGSSNSSHAPSGL